MRQMIKYRDYLIERLADHEEAAAYLQTSQEKYQKDGDTDAFLLALQSIAKAQAGNNELVSEVYLLSGTVHRSRGEYDSAIEDYNTVIKLTNTVIELNPNNVETYIRRGIAYHYKGEYGSAVEDFNKAIELEPNIPQIYLARGIAYHYKGEYGSAIEDTTKALELNPDNAEAYQYRGLAYQSKGDYDRSEGNYDCAIADFTKVIDLNPNDTNAYCGRGHAYQSKGDYDCAIADFTKAIDLNPNDARAYCGRGYAHHSKGDYGCAIEDCTKAIDLNPKEANVYNHRGVIYYYNGDYDRAIEDYNRAIQLNPNSARAYNNRGTAYRDKGEIDRAIVDFNRAIQFNSDYAEAYYNRGVAYRIKGLIGRAIEDYNRAIQLNPNSARAYNDRGAAYRDKGEIDRAIVDFNKAIQFNSDYAEAYYNRGVAYRVKGLIGRAIVDLNRAIQLNPNYADVYNHWTAQSHPKARKETRLAVNPLEVATEIDTFAGVIRYKRSTSRMSKETVEGITKIAVSGFKSLVNECAIDICPLTILAGANSSGKSGIMQPLLMLKQTLEAPYDPGPLLIEGPNVQFTLVEQFLSKLIGEERADRFQVQVETCSFGSPYSVRTTFRKIPTGIEIVEMTKTEINYQLFPPQAEDMTLYPGMPSEEIKSLADQHWGLKDFDTVKSSRCFLLCESQDGRTSSSVTFELESDIFNIIHLPGLRGNPERTYKLTSTGPWYPGTFEHYVASIIHEWQETRDERLETLANALYTLGLTAQVGTEKIGDTRIELQVGRLPLPSASGRGMDMVNITDVGLGVSQVLPVLVALIVAKPGQLVYLEQPELHLHPRAQVALAQELAAAARRGVRVVAETHSSLLLLAVQTLVAEGELSPELVKLHWFTRREDGATKIDTADLDEAGAYGDWPEDFDDVDLKAQSRYIKAAQLRLAERA